MIALSTKKTGWVTLDHSLFELPESPYDDPHSGSIYITSRFESEIRI
jgi:hypothetical protein